MRSVRQVLNKLYTGAGVLAGACIVLISVMILAQIAGRWFGVIIPSTEDFSGYLLAAASFLALAYTFRHGGHIRVTLLVHTLPGAWQRKLLHGALILFAVMVGYGAWYLSWMVFESWRFDDISQGYLAIPLWIPQLPMATGAVLFFIALIDDIARALQGGEPSFTAPED